MNTNENGQKIWKNCNVCKKPILCNSKYYVCSVSTCNQKRTGLSFCSVTCFDAHLGYTPHRDAGAIEHRAPSIPFEENFEATNVNPQRKYVNPHANQASALATNSASVQSVVGPKSDMDEEILVVVSKVKKYIHDKSEMNTSSDIMDLLSDKIRIICDRAIMNARQDGRKTVLDRDVPNIQIS